MRREMGLLEAIAWAAGAAMCFHLAWAGPLGACMVGFLWAVVELTRMRSARGAVYVGVGLGLAMYGPQLGFFYEIFGPAAVGLWLVLAAYVAVFLFLGQLARRMLPKWAVGVALAVLWTGTEYFRCELYYLRFGWLTPGIALGTLPWIWLGEFGVAFVFVAWIGIWQGVGIRMRAAACGVAILAFVLVPMRSRMDLFTERTHPLVVGVQMEQADEAELIAALNRAVEAHPDGDMFVLSEYSIVGAPAEQFKAWCRRHGKYLIVGGTDMRHGDPDDFFNTAFVIGPRGEICFTQAKAAPIQFFRDGHPAQMQRVWESPWGKIGICICYDLSYTRVTDELVRQGAQALIVPTMDAIHWGGYEHALHARIAPVRAAEYGIPIFRVASSGVSQWVLPDGAEERRAGFPGQGDIIAGRLVLTHAGHLPPDRWLAPGCTIATEAFILWAIVCTTMQRGKRTDEPAVRRSNCTTSSSTK